MTRDSPRPTPRVLRASIVAILLLTLAIVGPPTAGAESDPIGAWPLAPEPEVVHDFDPPAGPYSAGHRGVDLAGAAGQPVLAALPGTVSYAAPLAGRGVVVVDHGATRTTYQPVAASVGVGDAVTSGAPIGRLEVAGSHCLPRVCLHWGWVEGEVYLDPLRLVGAGPVRLLPLWQVLPEGSAPAVVPSSPYAAFRPLMELVNPFGSG